MLTKTLIAVGALLAVSAEPAGAQIMFHHDRTTVSFKDLDLRTPAGAQALMRRLHRASEEVCGPAWSAWGPGDEDWKRECVSETLSAAVARVNRPMLTALLPRPAPSLQLAAADAKAARP